MIPSTIIYNIIIVRADNFTAESDKAGRRFLANSRLKVNDLLKASTYSSTLQLKEYFSVLHDISTMYCSVDRGYVHQGLDMCSQLSKRVASENTIGHVRKQLPKYITEVGQRYCEARRVQVG
jgi:hypothetical protein